MVDFSMPMDDMRRLNDMCRLIWIDHHKTAIDAAHAAGFIAHEQSIEIGKAGCELTWEHVYPNTEMPRGVYLLGRYDVWDETVPKAWVYQAGMRTMEDTSPDSYILNNILQPSAMISYTDIIKVGRVILDYQTKENAIYAKSCCFAVGFHGYSTLACNKGLSNSTLFDSMWDSSVYKIMLLFVFRKGMWNITLYTTKDTGVDVGAIAKEYGGGGHVQAAGFMCSTLPFTLPIKDAK